MPSKTAARSGARSSRSRPVRGARPAGAPPRPARATPCRPSRPRASSRARCPRGLADAGQGCRVHCPVCRPRARPGAGHRRDGISLALLGIAVVIAASSRFDAARPVGAWIDTFLRVLIGSAVVLVPIVLAAIAVVLMRTEPDPEARPRLILGAAMIALPTLGLWHLWGVADGPSGASARSRLPRLRHRWSPVGWAHGSPRRCCSSVRCSACCW